MKRPRFVPFEHPLPLVVPEPVRDLAGCLVEAISGTDIELTGWAP